MATKKTIGFSHMTSRVYLGRMTKDKSMWAGNDREDITTDFLNVLFQYVKPNTGRTVSNASNPEVNILLNIKQEKESVKKAIKYLEKLLTKIS